VLVFERPHLRKGLVGSQDGAEARSFGMVRDKAKGLENSSRGTRALKAGPEKLRR